MQCKIRVNKNMPISYIYIMCQPCYSMHFSTIFFFFFCIIQKCASNALFTKVGFFIYCINFLGKYNFLNIWKNLINLALLERHRREEYYNENCFVNKEWLRLKKWRIKFSTFDVKKLQIAYFAHKIFNPFWSRKCIFHIYI